MKIAVQQSTGPLQGGAARRAQLTTDTNGLIGGDAQAVRFVTAAELAAGLFSVEGNGNDLEVVEVTDRGVMGGSVLPVYLVNFSVPDPLIPPAISLPNVASSTIHLNLQSNDPAIVALANGAPVSTWPDQSSFGRNFTQTGTARPSKQTVGGYPAVVFDGDNDWMLGPNFADNLSSFSVFTVVQLISAGAGSTVISKIANLSSAPGWNVGQLGTDFFIAQNGSNLLYVLNDVANQSTFKVRTAELASLATPTYHLYINGSSSGEEFDPLGTVSTYTTSEPVCLGSHGQGSSIVSNCYIRAVMLYSPAPNATDRAAIENWLMGEYGVTP